MGGRLATVPGAFVLDCTWILIEPDPVLAGQGHKALSACAADQSEARLAGKLHAPGGKAGTRNKHGNAHPDRFDDHLGSQAPGRVKNLIRGADAMTKHKPGDFVDRVVPPD